jgi:nitrogen fixation NifU-like protein
MMSELGDLYQQLILDHNARPHNFGVMAGATHKADGYNPLCGDKVRVFVQLQDGVIGKVGFDGSGCAISKASASLMTDALKGKKLDEADKIFEAFHTLLTCESDPEAAVADDAVELGKLEAFSGVREFPMRVKCATLAWHTLRAALSNTPEPVCTEH